MVEHFPEMSNIPEVTRSEMQDVDRRMIEDFGISLPQMMENAGRALAIVARDVFLGGAAQGKSVLVLAGSGGNGGGALTSGRRLAAWGAQVFLGLTRPASELGGVPRLQLDILSQVAAPPAVEPNALPAVDLILDGLIGYSLGGAPRGRAKAFIEAANNAAAPILALDVPSGFDAASGRAVTPSIAADATLTLALPKTGMTASDAIGRLFLADISVPPALYQAMGLDVPAIFSASDIVELV